MNPLREDYEKAEQALEIIHSQGLGSNDRQLREQLALLFAQARNSGVGDNNGST